MELLVYAVQQLHYQVIADVYNTGQIHTATALSPEMVPEIKLREVLTRTEQN